MIPNDPNQQNQTAPMTDSHETMGQDTGQDTGQEMESTPIDALISKVESYIQNPSMVTPETLGQLHQDLVSLKEDIDGEESAEGDSGNSGSSNIPSNSGMAAGLR